jgi:hypothetical protein
VAAVRSPLLARFAPLADARDAALELLGAPLLLAMTVWAGGAELWPLPAVASRSSRAACSWRRAR